MHRILGSGNVALKCLRGMSGDPLCALPSTLHTLRLQPMFQHHQDPDHFAVVARVRGKMVAQQSIDEKRLDDAPPAQCVQ